MNWGLVFSNALEAAIGADMVIYCLAAIGLNVHFGYAGLLNFGQAAFVAVAAYGLATMVATFGAPFWVGVTVGLAAVVVLALLLGIPTLRLRADYLAIVTLAAAEIVRLTFRSVTLRDTFGGSDGLQNFANGFYALSPFSSDVLLGPISFSARQAWAISIGWVLIILSCLLVWLLMRSPWGRVLKGIREDEDAVRSLGKNVYSYKLQALMVGGLIGALAGFMYAVAQAAVQPDYTSPDFTFFAYTILILGGAARVFGPVLGAAIFWGLLSLSDGVLRGIEATGAVPSWLLGPTDAGAFRFMIVGLALMLLMIFRPQGILGDRKELALDAR
jgi:branched-chain amino acid transport system permease protein